MQKSPSDSTYSISRTYIALLSQESIKHLIFFGETRNGPNNKF